MFWCCTILRWTTVYYFILQSNCGKYFQIKIQSASIHGEETPKYASLDTDPVELFADSKTPRQVYDRTGGWGQTRQIFKNAQLRPPEIHYFIQTFRKSIETTIDEPADIFFLRPFVRFPIQWRSFDCTHFQIHRIYIFFSIRKSVNLEFVCLYAITAPLLFRTQAQSLPIVEHSSSWTFWALPSDTVLSTNTFLGDRWNPQLQTSGHTNRGQTLFMQTKTVKMSDVRTGLKTERLQRRQRWKNIYMSTNSRLN